MSFLTLKEARLSTLKNIAGLDTGTDTRASGLPFIDRLNEATRRLMRRGDWSGTIIPMNVIAYQGMVVWPRYVDHIRALKVRRQHHNTRHTNPIAIKNTWYDFPEQVNTIDWAHGYSPRLGELAPRPTYNDIFDGGGVIYAIPQYAADNNKKLTIFGFGYDGIPLQTDNQDGTFTDGITLAMSTNQALGSYTSIRVGKITRVLKDVTQGMVQLFAFDPDTNIFLDLACYQGSEINPEYEASSLNMSHSPYNDVIDLTALVKLRFIPVAVDSDLVLIQNIDALKDMIQSLQYRESGETAQAAAFEVSAFRELNFELRNSNPKDSIQFTINTGISRIPRIN